MALQKTLCSKPALNNRFGMHFETTKLFKIFLHDGIKTGFVKRKFNYIIELNGLFQQVANM